MLAAFVIAVRTCPQDSSSGFLWASITEGSVLSLPCTQASSQFRPGYICMSSQCVKVNVNILQCM